MEEAIGGASAAKSFRLSDEKGFYESEVIVLDLGLVWISLWLYRSFSVKIVYGSSPTKKSL